MEIAIAALNEVAANARSDIESRAHLESSGSFSTTKPEAASDLEDPVLNPRQNLEGEEGQYRNSASSNNSQTTNADATTPPTSEDYHGSSLEHQSQLSQLSQLAAAQQPLYATAPREQHHMASNVGQKRTHDGFRKNSDSSSSDGSSAAPFRGHSRNMSAISAASSTVSARELTSELRTRLTYAMVKVNKGWEALPIDEVESLASQQGSPAKSSASTLNGGRNPITSPRTAIANIQSQSRSIYGGMSGSLPSSKRERSLNDDGQPTRTYESFWAQQGHKTAPGITTSQSGKPSLAPSVDITSITQSSNVRRLQSHHHSNPPALHEQVSGCSETSQRSNGTPTPQTPAKTMNPEHRIQTPSQKSVQEQDAIETLLFMSSPGNTGNINHTFPPIQGVSSQLQSPLRMEFASQSRGLPGRRVEFRGVPERSDGSDTSRLSGDDTRFKGSFKKLRDDEIDQLLDSVADPESSDDEIEIPIIPRRLAVGGE